MSEIKLKISYTSLQKKVFLECKKRFRVVTKGRRVGFTYGCANFVIESLLKGYKVLWVDTIAANIQRYFERYFMVILKQIPANLWEWSKQDKKLSFKNGGVLDMRGADRPENIEGFGYDLIVLNEAGIILKNSYLWDNAIAPMLLDNPNSIAIIGGVPKGKNKFYELTKNELKSDEWQNFNFSSFDNPLINEIEIKRLIDELGGEGSDIVRQEIYGKFSDTTSNLVFNISEFENAMKRDEYDDSGAIVWGLDVARFGDDKSALCIRHGLDIREILTFSGLNTEQLSAKVFEIYEQNSPPNAIFVDTTGIGAGVFDKLNLRGLPVREAIMSAKSSQPRYENKRAQMYFNLANKIKYLRLPNNTTLYKQAQFITYFYNAKDKIQLISKQDIKKEFNSSPDELDALAMTFYENVIVDENFNQDWSGNGW